MSLGDRVEPGPLFGWPRCRTIWSCARERGPLLFRHYILETRWVGIYLHHLMASDEDRALHDHPWSFITFLIGGGYWEHTPRGRTWRRRWSLLWRPAEWRHRLELVRPTWTLVVRFPRRREWGFILSSGRWMDWKSYGRRWCE